MMVRIVARRVAMKPTGESRKQRSGKEEV